MSSFLSSTLLHGQNTLAQTGVDVQKLIASAAGKPTCSYAARELPLLSQQFDQAKSCATSACSTISCSEVAQASSGATVIVQEWLAYNALANINNFFYYILDKLTPGADFTLGLSTNFADVSAAFLSWVN